MRARGLKLKMFCDWFLKSESTHRTWNHFTFFEFSLSGFSSIFFNYWKTFRVFSLFCCCCWFRMCIFIELLKWIGLLDYCLRWKTSYSTYKYNTKAAYGIYNKDSILIDGMGNTFYVQIFMNKLQINYLPGLYPYE